MKKHNEAKSIKGIRLNKGKIMCKVLSFTMIFVMLFCISASAEEEILLTNQTVKVKDSNGVYKNVTANIRVTIEDPEDYFNTYIYVESSSEEIILEPQEFKVKVKFGNFDDYSGRINIDESRIYVACSHFLNSATQLKSTENVELCVEIREFFDQILAVNDGEETTIVLPSCYTVISPPVYEGFMGNARGLFDLIFESMQSIFNWFVSPNVIVFFGLGIILSLTTIGILIARRFFWGR